MKDRVLQSCAPYAVIVLLMFAIATPTSSAQANMHGQWSTLPYLMPINPVHVALMYNGKVLVVSGSGNDPSNHNLRAAVWDPAAGTITVQTVAWDMFCNGMVVLPDGRPFINGGTVQYDPFYGSAKSSVFDPATNTFTDVQNMAHGRWYPTVTTLGDGRIMTFSGLTETGGTDTAVEIYTVGTGWSSQYTASWTPPLYPRMHLLPNGKVFYSGSGTTSRLFDPSAHTWSSVATTIYSGNRTYGSSVLLPLTPANNYDPRIMILGGANGGSATATTEIIDMGAATPQWQSGPSMSQGRIEMNAVLLPDGKVLAVGGSVNDENASTKSLNADLFDLTVPSMSSAGANTYARLYHSNALLMPDATVWFAGGNPVRGSYEQHMEIYQPAYLFNADGTLATRPTITSVPATISWGGSFTVTTPDAENIASVVLIRPGAPTHAFDMDQREVGVSFTKGSGTLTVTAPPNGNIAPPGYYLLFLLNNNGVPSVAKFTKLVAGLPAPTVSAISPNTGTANGGTAVTISGTNFRSGATVSLGGTAATGVTVVSATSITATTPAHSAGAVNVVVTNTDAQSASLNNGYTYTAVNPAPTVSAINPTSGTANGGTAVTITGTGFLAGATVKLGGTAATGVTVVNSTSITATTPAHAAGAVSVVVTNTDAQSGTLTNGYTYNGTNPAPTVTSINPTSGTTGGGTPVTITGTGFLAGATVAFGGTAATGVTVASSTSITATTPAHAAGAVNVVVTNTDAQSGTRTNGYTYTTSTGGGPIAFVQVNSATPPGLSTSVPVTFGLVQTAGNLNVVVVGWNDITSTISSVTDSLGNTYAQAAALVTGSAERQAIYYAKNIAGGSNTVTVAFNQAARIVDVRVLEYSGLDTNNPLDVTASAAGNNVTSEQRGGHHNLNQRVDLRSRNDRDQFLRRGSRIYGPDLYRRRRHRGRQGGEQHGQLQRHGTNQFRALGDADGHLPGGRTGRRGKSGTDGERDQSDIRNSEWRDGGHHHRHRLPGRSHSPTGRHIRDRRDRGQQYVDHGDHAGARGGHSQRGRHQHRCSERVAEQRLYLHGGEPGADGERDQSDIRNSEWRDGSHHHRHRLPGGRDSQAGRDSSHGCNCGEQHIDHGDDPGACGGCGQRSGDQHRCAERHLNQRLHLQRNQPGADGDFDQSHLWNHRRRNSGDHHGDGLPGGRDGRFRRDSGHRRDRGEQHVDHSDHSGPCGGGGECSCHQHGCPERNADQWLHLYHQHGGRTDRVRASQLRHPAGAQYFGAGDVWPGADRGQSERRGGGME